jgi:hypothetical protein
MSRLTPEPDSGYLFQFPVLLQKLPDERVLAMEEVMERAIEDEAAFFEHEERGVGVGLALRERNHAALVLVEAMGT